MSTWIRKTDRERLVGAESLALRSPVPTRIVSNGVHAIETARSHPTDVLLCSWLIEEALGGEEVTRRLHATHPSTAIVLISGPAPEFFAPRVRDLPVHRVLAKPVGLDEIVQAIEDAASSDH